MEKSYYPRNWREIRVAVKERAGWQCEECCVPEGTIATGKQSGKQYIIYLHAAHLDADPTNPHARLVALCPSCHMKRDRREELQDRVSVRRRGYSFTTTDKLMKAVEVAGLIMTETPDGYSWQIDDLHGKATNAVDAVADAIYYLRQARSTSSEEHSQSKRRKRKD